MINEPLMFVVYSLAVYRLTRFITTDYLFDSVRQKLWNKYPPESSKIGYLFTCNWCMSFWSASVLLISSTITHITDWFAVLLALSAISGLLSAYEEK